MTYYDDIMTYNAWWHDQISHMRTFYDKLWWHHDILWWHCDILWWHYDLFMMQYDKFMTNYDTGVPWWPGGQWWASAAWRPDYWDQRMWHDLRHPQPGELINQKIRINQEWSRIIRIVTNVLRIHLACIDLSVCFLDMIWLTQELYRHWSNMSRHKINPCLCVFFYCDMISMRRAECNKIWWCCKDSLCSWYLSIDILWC